MSIHGAIDERVQAALAAALEPLIQRLEALEQQLLQGSKPVTTEPDRSLPPVQYASGGSIAGSRDTGTVPAMETLPEEEGEEGSEPPRTPPRKRPSRAKSTSVPEA